MKTRNSMQLKARINNKAKAAGVSPQLMLQNYMLERLIDRISRSPWRECVIVKGGHAHRLAHRRRQANTRAFEYSCAPATARCRFRLQLT